MGSTNRLKSEIERSVERSIGLMRDNLSEPLTIDDLARSAQYSKFHFSREFQKVTGVSPGRFLSALRIQEAKKLLLTTTLTVTDISLSVGYNSVGTFSSRFSASVGLSPSEFRRKEGFIGDRRFTPSNLSVGSVCGTMHTRDASDVVLIFLGLFPTRIPEGKPVCCTVLPRVGPFELRDVPQGSWYLLGHSMPDSPRAALMEDEGIQVGSLGPIDIRGNLSHVSVEFRLRGRRILDPPVLTALRRIHPEVFDENLVGAIG